MSRLERLARFALVGASVALLYIGIYVVLIRAGLAQFGANAIAFGFAVIVQYMAQARFTFDQTLGDRRQIVRFAGMIALGFLTAQLVTGPLATQLSLSAGLAALIVVSVLPVQNYALMALWVFVSTDP